MSPTLRTYQQEALEAVFRYWREQGTGNPLVELATGLGKSLLVAAICKRLLTDYPTMRIVMLVHVRELVRQNFEELLRLWPDAPVGVYSAGLGQRDTHHRIIFASIQSVYKRAEILAPRHLVLVDEAHLVPHDGDGMYREFLDGLMKSYPKLKVCGLTATAFRLDSGRLDKGKGRIFDRIVYSYGIGEGTDDGYLSPLTARLGSVEIDVGGVARRGGEFVPGALNHAANKADLIDAACDDMVLRAGDRKSWLVFCSGVDHAHAVCGALQERGITAACVTGNTPGGERDRIIDDFKAGRIRALTNAQVLTTGFNAPGVDMIALLRPTLSTGLYVQMMGRGTRLAAEKANCLVLDYAGNIRRHGPVDDINVADKKKRTDGLAPDEDLGKVAVDEVRAKECPGCGALQGLGARTCPECGHVFAEPKHQKAAEDIAVMKREIVEDWAPVTGWRCAKWVKRDAEDAPPTLRIDIMAGVGEYAEWVCFEHSGFARTKAQLWWRDHGGQMPVPDSVDEAILRFDEVRAPSAVTLMRDGKYYRINKRRFSAAPAEAGA